MKLILLLLLLPTKFILVCQPGYLKTINKTYILECKDNNQEECIFNLCLPDGTYTYFSPFDTTTFKIDSGKVKELKPLLKQKLTIYQ